MEKREPIVRRETEKPAHLLLTFPKLHKKQSFPLRISLVNVTKSIVSCAFGHIY